MLCCFGFALLSLPFQVSVQSDGFVTDSAYVFTVLFLKHPLSQLPSVLLLSFNFIWIYVRISWNIIVETLESGLLFF